MTMPTILLPEGALDDPDASVESFCWLMSSAIAQDDYWSPSGADEALNLYHALLYQGEVRNGGHAQFLANCDNRAAMFAAARAGLGLIGAATHAAILESMIDWARENPGAVEAMSWDRPETVRLPALAGMDDQFFAANDERSVSQIAHDWLCRSEKVRLLPQKEFEETVFRYQAKQKP